MQGRGFYKQVVYYIKAPHHDPRLNNELLYPLSTFYVNSRAYRKTIFGTLQCEPLLQLFMTFLIAYPATVETMEILYIEPEIV